MSGDSIDDLLNGITKKDRLLFDIVVDLHECSLQKFVDYLRERRKQKPHNTRIYKACDQDLVWANRTLELQEKYGKDIVQAYLTKYYAPRHNAPKP